MKGMTLLESFKEDVKSTRRQMLELKSIGGLEYHRAEYRHHLAKNALINFKERMKSK